MKKIIAAATLALAGVALPSQAALLATWDASMGLSGSINVTDPISTTVNINGGGGGGTATLDTNGTFSFFGLNSVGLNLDIGLLGGGNLNLSANGDIVGTYDSLSQQLSGNVATLNVSENIPCAPYGLAGGAVCDAVPGVISFDNPFVLTSAEGLTDPITFDLVNNFSFLVGQLGGTVAMQLNLSNVQVSAVPVPAAAWLFSSALLGLAGIARKRKAAQKHSSFHTEKGK